MYKESRMNERLVASMLCGLLLIITACAGDETRTMDPTQDQQEPAGLIGPVWQVEDIDNGGIIDSSHVTLQLSAEGRVNGYTGCNQYFGSVNMEAGSFQVDNTGSTRRACVPAIMQQEQQFLQALHDVRRYEMDGEFLRLYDETGVQRLRMIQSREDPARAPAP